MDDGELPISKGMRLTEDDHVRAAVISQLICNLTLDTTTIEEKFSIDFAEYFSRELLALKPMEEMVTWLGRCYA